MSIQRRILGKPFADNALFATVDSGQQQTHLLFDCGEGTCNELSVGTLQKIDHLFFSHFHLDHIAGFDHFIRANYNRTTKPVHIWGPEDTIEIIFHRMNSFSWNLISDVPSEWFVHEITPQKITTTRLLASEAFARKHPVDTQDFDSNILDSDHFKLSVRFFDHRINVLGFKLQEKFRFNIDKAALIQNKLPEGPYLEKLKNLDISDSTFLEINGKIFNIGYLRNHLLKKHRGFCLSYLTDFIFRKNQLKEWADWLDRCDELVCESQYLSKDSDLARLNYHLTTKQAAQIAKQAQVKSLILIHFSRRYQNMQISAFLDEAKQIFKNTFLPKNWD